MLANVVVIREDAAMDFDEQGLLVEDDGALCVFPEGFENRQGDPLPLIVRKSDGGYGYPATDLATVRDRTGRLGATRLLYVVGNEQSLHLRLVFAVSALAGYLRDGDEAVHVGFGLVLGTDGKKLASRSGGSDRLIDLLSEAEIHKPNLKRAFLINRKIVNTAIGRDVTEALSDYPTPVLKTAVCQRVAFAESAAQGLTVFESPASAAARARGRGRRGTPRSVLLE